jgi:hypothetical protein
MTPQMAVRRLTPRECERLQGFPDDYTLVEYRGKPAADGPRYKALGNSMAVPVMRWIGERIAAVDAILRDRPRRWEGPGEPAGAHSTILARTSQPRREEVFFLPLPPRIGAVHLALYFVAQAQVLRMAYAEDDGGRTVRFTHSLLLQPDWWPDERLWFRLLSWLHRHPERHAVLHASVSVQRHPSSYFPCSPSVTRLGADPAPCGNGATLLFRHSENLFGKPQERRKKRFSEPSENASLGLGSGAPRVASRKSVPRAIRANTNKEKHNGTLRKQRETEGLHRQGRRELRNQAADHLHRLLALHQVRLQGQADPRSG